MKCIRSFFVLPAGLVVHAVAASTAGAVPAELNARPIVRIADQSRPRADRDVLLRMRAEDLARAASERFTEILSDNRQERIAQTTTPEDGNDSKSADLDDGTLRPVWDWLGRASDRYEDVIIAKFRNPSGSVAIIAPPGAAEPQPAAGFSVPSGATPELTPALSWGYVVENIREWLARANRSYRNEIVKELVRPLEEKMPAEDVAAPSGETGAREAPTAEPANVMEPQKALAPEKAEHAIAPVIPEPAETARTGEASGSAIPPPERKSAIAEVAPDAESKTAAAEAQRKAKAKAEAAEEAKRRAAEEGKRLAEEAEAERKAVAEAERLKKVEEEAKRKMAAAEAKKRAQKAEVERKAAKERRKAEVDAEAKRRAAEEGKRKAEAAESKREADEAKRKAAAEAEAKRRAEEAAAKRKVADADAERQRLARAEVSKTGPAAPVVPPERKASTPKEVPSERDTVATGADADTDMEGTTEAPAAAAPAVPKAREERIVAEPERATVEKKRHRVSKSRYRKKRVRKYRSRRYAAHARRYREETRVYRYRYRKEVRRKRAVYRKRHWRKRHRICGKTRRNRHRRSHGSGGVYVVRRGDTLTKIARRYYGNGRAYRAIYRANRRKIRNPNLIYPRQRLYIP